MNIRNIFRYAWLAVAAILFVAVAVFPLLRGMRRVPIVFAVTAFQSLIFATLGLLVLLAALGSALVRAKTRRALSKTASTSAAHTPRNLYVAGSCHPRFIVFYR